MASNGSSESDRRRIVLLQGAGGASNPAAFSRSSGSNANAQPSQPLAPARSSTNGSSNDSGEKTRLTSAISKCRMIIGDLETTAVLIDELLKENQWSKAAIDMELAELQQMLDAYAVAHLEIMRICELSKIDTKQHVDRRQRFLVRHKKIRNLLMIHLPSDVSTQRSETTATSTLKLPRVEIPMFEGDFEHWSSWFKLFESLVHKNESLDDMNKFTFLRSRLKGVPLSLVESYPFESEFYEAAFNSIVCHYNDPLKRISRILDTVQNAPPMKDKKQTLRSLITLFRANATALQITFQQNEEIDPLSQLLIHSFLSKADNGTRQDWEREITRRKRFATFTEFVEYMEGRCNAYERAIAGSSSNNSHNSSDHKSDHKFRSSKVLATTLKKGKCYYCLNEHSIYKCSQFLALSIADRQKYVADKNWCQKCLSPRCNKKCPFYCRTCKKGHNVLLHNDRNNQKQADAPSGNQISLPLLTNLNSDSEENNANCQHLQPWIGNISLDSSEALLATAQVTISNVELNIHCSSRALVDSASQSNLITLDLVKLLNLNYESTSSCNLGSIQGHQSTTLGCVKVQIAAQHTNFSTMAYFEIVDEIIDLVPQNSFDVKSWKIPKNIILADTHFNVSAKVNLLLGLRIFWKILGSKKLCLGKNLPCLRNSKFGWLVTDDRLWEEPAMYGVKNIFVLQTNDQLSSTIRRFWLLDEFDSKSLSFEELECEKLYSKTTSRILDGKFGYFLVRHPFKISPKKLGHSRSLALKRFYALEKRLSKNLKFKIEYHTGMKDYLDKGHMKLVCEFNSIDIMDEVDYFMPHHAIIKETSTSTKLRNVFDASMPTSSGLSLNDCLMVGPVVQSDLITVIMRFRLHKIVFTADIVQMYRQVRLHDDDTRFQKIFWRAEPTDPLKVYKIVTLAFGTASAPFLATRCLKALVELDGKIYPHACSALLYDFYVDDVLTGANNISDALKVQQELQEILARGGFTLSKWCSNSNELLSNIPENKRETKFPFSLDKDDKIIKSLGLLWSSINDSYQVKVNISDFSAAQSKRQILSIIASIFDPLGFISPVTVIAKLLIQNIWSEAQSKCSPKCLDHWDEKISTDLSETWLKFASTLNQLHDLQLPRYLFLKCTSFHRIEIHGFSDASEKAYRAVIYIRAIGDNEVSSSLFFAKSRVAPLKRQSLPRLELCAALLLCELIEKVQLSLKNLLTFDIIRLWTDSQIVLHWIASPSSRWLPFVANRVQKIQNLSKNCFWDYVHTKSNPADLISRGSTPSDLKSSNLWWQGPDWLLSSDHFTSEVKFVTSKKSVDVEIRRSKRLLTFVTIFKSSIFTLSSNYWKLVRLVSWVTRFCLNAHSLGPIFSGPLQIIELREAIKTLVKLSQREYFLAEYKRLKAGESVEKSSSLASLSPFLDNCDLIRVGGRLQHSNLSFDQQHPLVLHPKHELSKLIIRYHHELHFHAGPQLLRSILRNQFWILRVNNAIRHCIIRCAKCIRVKADTRSQAMAALPKDRVTPSKPFSKTGVDYAGPFSILGKGGRHKVMVKAYIAIFVCFSTKAIHLELVSDLTSEAFLAAFTRFISRRGVPVKVYSDNGTNFVGAQNLLKKQFKEFLQSNFDKISSFAANKGSQWHFIPPYAPHFGGLWEAGVKSVKGHLRFVLSKNNFTFEQWATLLAQIEACLNSRPLIIDSTDPSEPSALTPGHFLIGGPIVGLPNPDLKNVPENRLKHWQLVKAQAQKFWHRWSTEYLNTLQQKNKWKFKKDAVKINDVVIVKELNSPPTCWPLGQIEELHSGSDGCTRVVTIRTASGVIKRPIVKVIPLPTLEDD